MGMMASVVMFGVMLFITVIGTLFATSSGLKEQYNYRNVNEKLEKAASDFETKYFADYDFLNLPMGHIPDVASTAAADSALGTVITNLDKLLDDVRDADTARKVEGVYLNNKRVCVKKTAKDDGSGKVKLDQDPLVVCSSFPEGKIDSVNYSLFDGVDFERGTIAVSQLLSSLGSDVFVSLGRNNVKYLNNNFPSLGANLFPGTAGNKVDGKADPHFVDIDKGVNERILQAKDIMDKIYSQFGEKVKREHKGYVKVDQVSPFNPFAVIGDAVDAKKSKRMKFIDPKTRASDDTTGDETVYEKYHVVGDNQKEGFGTSNAIALSYSYLNANAVEIIGGLAGCKTLNDEFAETSSSTPYFSNRYYLVCDDPKAIYRAKCVGEDAFCKEAPRHEEVLLENFCLSSEPCYVKYETDKDVIKGMEVMSADYMLKTKYNLGADSYQNPFYPNAKETLFKEEQKGLIFSSNNQAIASGGAKSFLILGLKFVPTKEAYEKADSLYNENFYILNKYIVQTK